MRSGTEQAALWDQAARFYQTLADRYPKDQHAADALFNGSLSEGDAVREMAVSGHLCLPPNDPEVRQPWRALAEFQGAITERGAAGASRATLSEAQVNSPIAGEIGRNDDIAEPALPRNRGRRGS